MRLRCLALILLLIAGFLLTPGVVQASNDDVLTRGEVLQVLLDAKDEYRGRVDYERGHLSRLPLFTDVSSDDEIAPYAEAAFALRITSGFADRTLRPHDAIPVEEAITLLLRAYRVEGESAPGDAWFVPFIRSALRRNLIANPRSIRVGDPLTRGQFFDMVARMEVVTRDNLAAYPQPVRIVQRPGRGVTAGPTASQPGQIGSVLVARPSEDEGALGEYRSSRDFAITIPSLGIRDLQVSHPEDPQSKEGQLAPLQGGVGHLYSYPGRGGKIMIYGHSSGYSWDVSEYTKIFQQVNKLKKGEKVFITFNGNLYEYEVTGQQKIAPNDKTPFSGDGEELILYTCWPVGSNKSRLIIRAVPVETVAVR